MNDLISRAAAIEAVMSAGPSYYMTQTNPGFQETHTKLGAFAFRTDIRDAIRALPAAPQPEAEPVAWFCGGCGETDPAKRCVGCLHVEPAATRAPVVPAEGLDALVDGWDTLKDNLPPDGHSAAEVLFDYGDKLADAIQALRAQQPAAPVSGVTVQEAARVLLDRLQYSSEADFIDAMQQVMPTEQTADLYAGLTAALSALEGK